MPLQFQLDSIDGLDEVTAKLYVERDGKYILDIEGLPAPASDKGDMIPKSRFDEVIGKKKAAEDALKAVADGLIEGIPEEMRDIIPDLAPAQKISWLQSAQKKGLFDQKAPEKGPDANRPGGTPPQNFDNSNPIAMISQGYKK